MTSNPLPPKVARVVSISGSKVIALLDPVDHGGIADLPPRAPAVEVTPPDQGGGDERIGENGAGDAFADVASIRPRGPQIGEVVKVVTPLATVFGLVTSLDIPLNRAHGDVELRVAEVELLGEIEHSDEERLALRQVAHDRAAGHRSTGDRAGLGQQREMGDGYFLPDGSMPSGGKHLFQRGVSMFPSLDDAIYLASEEDLRHVFMQPTLNSVRIGTLHQDRSVPAYVVPNSLLGKHFSVLGTTGSGKSCAVTAILRAILAQHDKAHIVLLDPHDEYYHGFGDLAERVTPADLELPYWLLNFDELVEMVLGNQGRGSVAEMAVLNQFVTKAKRDLPQNAEWKEQITVDTPVPYRLSDVIKQIEEVLGKLEKPTDLSAYLRVRERLHALQSDPRYAFMFPGIILRDNMTKILSRLFRVPVNGKPISIIDISGLPTEILNVVVSLIFRMVFDFALWSDQKVPILLVCEEAHRYAPDAEQTAFEPSKRGLTRIAREGRKYGVSLCLVSQRPSELSATVLSQCSTIFALRMTNIRDQSFLAAALPEASTSLMSALSSLRNGEAVAVGEGVPVPARIRFDRLPKAVRPRSHGAPFARAWDQEETTDNFLERVVSRWRKQR